jgi:hypothetical protein
MDVGLSLPDFKTAKDYQLYAPVNLNDQHIFSSGTKSTTYIMLQPSMARMHFLDTPGRKVMCNT